VSTGIVPVPPFNAVYRMTFAVLDLMFERYFTAHVSGREHLPPPGTGTIVIINHTSALDPFVVGYAVHRTGHFVSKVENTRLPVVGRFFLAVGAIPAQRDQRDLAALRLAMAVLEGGGMLGLAPEGTRSRDGRLHPFDPGFVWLATRTGALVVPCVVHGAYQLLPKGARVPRRGPLWVRFGPPISFAAEGRRAPRERLVALGEDARARSLAMLTDLVRESGVPNPAVTNAA
jgi:1-acyl-sn-glycerol-3-phosphate acyltransferase